MSSTKLTTRWGVLADLEASYGAGATLTAGADGHLVVEEPVPEMSFIDEGERRLAAASVGRLLKTGPTGRQFVTPIVMELVGAAVAYSATQFPNIHKFLLASGFAGVNDTTVGVEKWTYTPESSGFDSLGVEIYLRGHKYILTSGYCDWVLAADGPVIPRSEFTLSAIGGVPTDLALPAITYPDPTTQPPKAVDMTFTLNAVATTVLRSFTLTLGREIAPRADDNSSGHAGFSPGRRAPTLEVLIEAEAVATFDPYTLQNDATAQVIAAYWGSTQYNRFKIDSSNAVLSAVSEDADGPTALWALTYELSVSQPTLEDDLTLIAD